ncbi:uncharacterized protein PHACADRAFT_256255 [Phanerochaete carnosa HHB-10118-sp]|uniref:Uncharacterized protein n=1 Tax=Phanerochaete carnosa (strain HHB-10118-sp) TaxID=650164 RepID=K5WYG4_PHACS|nr:uncharacterized protein PHACADRAFT_256255 [Phanerochaete carnosa HHB-10118-sp]EKM55547.1 hypothetical protein PHACADRAFT_256255 [Phanerochaete carnosa HHB-10118-sp]
MAVVFCILSLLFGTYFILFIIAVWVTFLRTGQAWQRLRVVTVILFLVLCAHYCARALTFARARIESPPASEEAKWTVPLIFVGAITSTLAGFISDGLLAWRFYVIYGRTKIAMYLPTAMVVVTALLGLSGSFQQLTIYRSAELYNNRFAMIALDVNAAWGWCTFGVNTILTASIIGRIMCVARDADAHHATGTSHRQYSLVLEAIVESALVTWFGLLFYEIASLAPTGHITGNFDIGYVTVCITPIYFGISQCLITARLALITDSDICARDISGQLGYGTRPAAQTGSQHRGSRISPMTFKVPKMSETDSMDDSTVEAAKAE